MCATTIQIVRLHERDVLAEQIAQPNIPDTTVVGVQQGTSGAAKGFQYGYSVTQYGSPAYAADKSGKDDNFRGETIFHKTLYVTKGSGGQWH